MCEYHGYLPSRGRIAEPRWPIPRPPAQWVLRKLGQAELVDLVAGFYEALLASPIGYRLPIAADARRA